MVLELKEKKYLLGFLSLVHASKCSSQLDDKNFKAYIKYVTYVSREFTQISQKTISKKFYHPNFYELF